MKKFTVILSFVLCLLLLIGCSNSRSGSGSSPAESDSSKKVPSDTLAQIKKNGKIVIGTGGDFRPFTYKNSKNELVGYDIEWGKIIAKKLGVKPEFVTGEFSGLIPGLKAGRFDILASAITATPERKAALNISAPYAKDGPVAVVRKNDNKTKDIKDIKEKVVGANAGSVYENAVKKIGGYKELKTYPGPNQGLADLANGRIDVEAIGLISAKNYIKNAPNGDQFKIVGEPYEIYNCGIGMRKGDDSLTKAINKIIQEEKDSGTMEKLSNKYLGVYIK